MSTIKSYTDIPQSKKLAEFLPLESADMHYHYCFDFDELESIPTITEENDHFVLFPEDVRCWSLAALFNVISNAFRYNLDYNGISFILTVGDFEVSNKTIVDACVDMIKKLYELKILLL